MHTADWAAAPGGRDFVQAMTRTWTALESAAAPEPRTARFRCTLVLAWPDGHDEVFEGAVEGRCVWPMRGTAGTRLRPDVPARRPATRAAADLRRDGPGGEEPDQPPGPGLRPVAGRLLWLRAASPPPGRRPGFADRGLASRRLRGLCPLALLRGEMPLLRLQQPRADRDRRGALGAGAGGRGGGGGAAGAGAAGRYGLLRRRHPEPDAARDRGHGARGDRGGMGPRPRRRGDARGQSDLGRGRAFPRLPRRRGQPVVDGGAGARRPGVEGTRADARRRRGAARLRGGPRDLSAGELRPHLCAPGPGGGGLDGGTRRGDGDGGRPPVAVPAHHRARDAVRRPRGPRAAARPAGGRGGGDDVCGDPGAVRGGGDAGLRDLEPRPARGGEPAQPRLLALRRLCRDRARGARAAYGRRGPVGDGGHPDARDLARGGRERRPGSGAHRRSPPASRRSRWR